MTRRAVPDIARMEKKCRTLRIAQGVSLPTLDPDHRAIRQPLSNAANM
jgi:hypothetical protein